MGMFQRLAGTVLAFLQIGGPTGPGFNANAGALEARNAANSAFAITRNANPADQNDSVNIAYNPWAGPNTPPLNGSWTQTDWYISPATGNNANTGLLGSPLATKAEVARRMGTWSPCLNGITVTIHYLDSDTNLNDPSLFAPFCINGSYFIQTSPLPAATFTGTLNVVTAKNTATNTILSSSFNVTTGAVAANMMLVNTTRGNSRAFAQRNKGAGVWQISQPLTPYVLNTFPGPTENNAWATTDNIIGYTLTNVNIPKQDGTTLEFDGAFGNSNLIYQLNIWSSGAIDSFVMRAEAQPFVVECSCVRNMACNGAITQAAIQLQNVAVTGTAFMNSSATNGIFVFGGYFAAGSITGVSFANSTILTSGIVIQQSNSMVSFAIDTGVVATLYGNVVLPAAGSGRIYGPGTLNVAGQLTFGAGQSAVNQLPVATLQLNGKTTAYSNVTAGGAGSGGITTAHNLNLTAANLDAAAGAAGFGGSAYGAGCAITNGVQA